MYKRLRDLQSLINPNQPCKRLVLAVSQDTHSLQAVNEAYHAGLIEPVLVGSKAETLKIADEKRLDFSGALFVEETIPERAVETAVRMIHEGKADVLMKGKISTQTMLRAVLNKNWGLRTERLLSHIGIFEVEAYHKVIAVTDTAMNIAPDLNAKIAIVNNSVDLLNKIGIENPKVAVLGAIEVVNVNMQATLDAALLSKMNQRDQIRNCIIDGPLAFDNAISHESAMHKGIRSDVAGDTDLLLMPNIEVGNVLYKSLVWLAHAKVAGVILGAAAPIVLTSRSDSEESKFDSILLATLG